MRDYILVVDEGTTGTRAIIYDKSFKQVASAYQELGIITPAADKVEQNFQEIFDKSLENCKVALEKAGLTAADIAAMGITNQRNTVACWNKETGELYGNGIVWQDTRVAARIDERDAKEGYIKKVMDICGYQVCACIGDLVLEWMVENIPNLKEDLLSGKACYGTVDTWLTWKFTEGRSYKIASSNASALGIYDHINDCWAEELVTAIGLNTSIFPEVVAEDSIFGETTLLGEAIPISGVIADQQSSLFGQNCRVSGSAKCTNGTGSFMDINIGTEFAYPGGGMSTMTAWTVGGKRNYMYEGNVFVTGSAIQWLRDGLGIIAASSETYDLATSVDSTEGVYFVINLAGAQMPVADAFARGTLIGINRGTTKAHITRATLEGIAFAIAHITDALAEDKGVVMQNIKIDGGASKNDFLAQSMADFINCDIYRPTVTDGTALGSALIASLGVGMYTMENLPDPMEYDKVFTPALTTEERAERMYFYKKAAERSYGWLKKD